MGAETIRKSVKATLRDLVSLNVAFTDLDKARYVALHSITWH